MDKIEKSGHVFLKELNERKERAKKKDPMKIFKKTTKTVASVAR
jgi:hypothetical protein